MTSITEIINRLEKSEAPDRELDAEIAIAFDIRPDWLLKGTGEMWLDKENRCIRWKDGDIRKRGFGNPVAWYFGDHGERIPFFTGSVDAAIALCERVLPGWGHCLGTCWVSDDARVFPDYNSPTHGQRLKERFAVKVGAEREKWAEEVEWVDFTDVALSPPRGLAIALCLSILIAVRKIEELEAANVPAV
jgi:hypothetical protein